MRILHTVESYYPSVGGMQEVVKQLSERLVKLGHQVTVATKKHDQHNFHELNGVIIKEFSIEGNLVKGISGETEKYKEFLLQSDYDIVTFFAAQQWTTDLALPILSQIKAKKISVPTGYSAFYFPEYKEYYEKMKDWIQMFDANIYLSDNYRDVNFGRQNHANNVTLIPNGAGEDEFLPEIKIDIKTKFNISPDTLLVLHVAGYTGMKGHKEALEIFLKSKVPNAALLMIGNDNEKFLRHIKSHYRFLYLKILKFFKKKQVIITSLSREETVAAFKTADLFLFPSNIECSPIVLFECMAAKLPFLSTNVGNAAEITQWSKSGIILPTITDHKGYVKADIKKSVVILDELLLNAELRESLRNAGFEIWKVKFSWEVIIKKYETLYLDLLKK